MKSKDRYVSKVRHELQEARKRSKGRKFVLKSLSETERVELESSFKVDPWLYRVRLLFLNEYRPSNATPSIIKQLYYFKKQTGNYERYLHLTHKQVEICREFGLEVCVHKYKIS